MIWLVLRLMRPYLAVTGTVTAASTAYVLYGATVVQRQLDTRGLPHCVNPNWCWPSGAAMDAVLGMQLVAAFVPMLLGLILGVPLFAREREEQTAAFVLTQSISRRRWVITKLGCALAVGAACAGVVATTHRLIGARYTLLANDLYELIEVLHLNHIGFMVMQTVLTIAICAILGLATGRTLRTLMLSLVCWPLSVVATYAGVLLLSYPLALLPIGTHTVSPLEDLSNTANDDPRWLRDISYADGVGYAATAVLIVYVVAIIVLATRRVSLRAAH
jgi:ABC-type transport system involved in multi-copper enzyme maturation permease subunit